MTFNPAAPARARSTDKIVSARDAVRLIRSGDTVIIGGFLSIGFPDVIVSELASFYESHDEGSASFGKPRGLTLLSSAGMGHPTKGGGMNRLAQPGLIKRFVSSHFVPTPALQQLIVGNQIEGYNLPLGAICHLFRDIAGGKPGHASRIGLGTFVDPRLGGGKLNEQTTEDLVELITVGGKEYLFFKAMPVNVAIIRGTTADADGNISMEREALTIDVLSRGVDRRRPVADRARRHGAEVRRGGRAPPVLGAFCRARRQGSAVHHRTLRVAADEGRARADRGRPGHRHRTRHPRQDGVQADRAPDAADGSTHLQARTDGPARGHAAHALRCPLQVRRGTQHPVPQPVGPAGHDPRVPRPPGREGGVHRGAARSQGLRRRQLRRLRTRSLGRRCLPRYGEDADGALSARGDPLHHQRVHARQARRDARPAGRRRAHLRVRGEATGAVRQTLREEP